MFKKSLLVLSAAAVLAACSPSAPAQPVDDTTMQQDAAMNDDTMMMQDDPMMDDSMKETTTAPSDGVMVGGAMMVPSNDIVTNAIGSKDHTTLVAAVKAAGLVETLQGPGPFTVFAPTNAAFAKLPAGTVETLLKPESKAKLTAALTYHVVPGKYTSADFTNGMKLKTVQGQEVTITEKAGKWYVNDAMITIPDVMSSNGVTFVTDTVIMPKM